MIEENGVDFAQSEITKKPTSFLITFSSFCFFVLLVGFFFFFCFQSIDLKRKKKEKTKSKEQKSIGFLEGNYFLFG